MYKAAFILTSSRQWVSARIRAEWPAAHIPDSVVVEYGPDIPQAENYIWIKAVGEREIDNLPGRHWWDICDPAWWWSPGLVHIARRMSGVVCSCQALADDFEASTGLKAHVIADRLDLNHYPLKRTHQAARPVRFVWFGASQNRISLFGAIANLERLVANGVHLELTIVDDHANDPWTMTDDFPIYYTPWRLEYENEIYAAHDIALLPPYPGAWGRVKSNNKALTAWACGLPVTDGFDYDSLLDLAVFPAKRASAAAAGLDVVFSDYTADKSAAEWMELWQR